MQHCEASKLALFLTLSFLSAVYLVTPPVGAASPYQVTAFPFYSQEGSTITIVLTVSGATPNTKYSFNFQIRDPSTTVWTSQLQNYTTAPFEQEFGLIILFPSPEFPCGGTCPETSLTGTYLVNVNQILPSLRLNVAGTWFFVGLTDRYQPYQRTETVSIVATGYAPGEGVLVEIRTSVSLVLVYQHNISASSSGVVADSWKIPKDATVTEDYVLTLTGSVTSKNPADAQGFTAQAAQMTVPSLISEKTTYMRTEVLSFSFQARYPSGENATTGLALVTLTRPDRANTTLTANYNATTQRFVARYATTVTNQTGTWTASLAPYSFDDSFGNQGPNGPLVVSPTLQIASLAVTLNMKTSFAANELITFNATISYPNGALLQSGNVSSTLSYSGGGFTRNVPIIYDSALSLWLGNYSPAGNEPSGLWSLVVNAADTAPPPNTGSVSRAITIQNRQPFATFSGSTNNAQTGVSISFDASSSSDPDGTIINYLWDFGDGSSGSGVITSHTYATAGTYIVRLTVTDNIGGTATTNSALTITAAPTPPSPTGGNVTFPLYWFAILAALIAAGLAGAFLAFRRHKVTHARLKIDLEAVRTEAGRIENNEFFQSVKDQLKKDKND